MTYMLIDGQALAVGTVTRSMAAGQGTLQAGFGLSKALITEAVNPSTYTDVGKDIGVAATKGVGNTLKTAKTGVGGTLKTVPGSTQASRQVGRQALAAGKQQGKQALNAGKQQVGKVVGMGASKNNSK
jgi:hypothetical protein